MSGEALPRAVPVGQPAVVRRDSPGRRALRRFLRHRLAVAGLLVVAIFVLLANLLTDVAYAVVDPRIRYS